MSASRRLPRRRPDLVVRSMKERGHCVVKDPRSGSYFQLGAHEQFLLNQLDGQHTSATVRRAFESEFGEPLSEAELAEFLDMAAEQQMLAAAAPPSATRLAGATVSQLLGRDDAPPAAVPPPAPEPAVEATPVPAEGKQSLLFWRKSLIDPDRLLDRMVPWLGFLWSRGFLFASLTAAFLALFVVVANWADLMTSFTGAMRWETAALVWVAMLLATTLHEFAHGLTLKRYGGEVREIGVLVMFFMPCLYCNVSDAWLLPERRKRLLVTLAGGYCDLCVWALAVFVWRLTPPESLTNYLAFVALTVLAGRILFNFNPFLKLDGYYLLGDWLGVHNLLERGQDRAKAHLRRLLWGAPRPPADSQGRTLTLYGLASWGFGLAFLSAAVFGVLKSLWVWLGPAGVAAASVLAVVLVKGQFKGLAGGEFKAMIGRRPNRVALWLLFLAGAGGLAAIPIPDRAAGSFRVRSGGKTELRAPATAILRELYFDEGEDVPAGAVVARLEVPDLASRQARKRAEATEACAKLDLLLAGPNPAKVAELTARVERADRWHDLAKADLVRDRAVHAEEKAQLDAQVDRYEAELKQAGAAFDRVATLRKQSVASVEEYDAATARVAVCRGQLAQAKAERAAARTRGAAATETELARRAKDLADATGELAVLTARARPEEIAAARAAVARVDEECRYLDELSGRLTISIRSAGIVTTARLRERVGRLFQEGELIAEVENLAGLEVDVNLREGQSARVMAGQEVELLARAFPFQSLRGRVVRIAPAARRPGERLDTVAPQPVTTATQTDAEGQVAVLCELVSPDPGLRPGMTGHARITRSDRPGGYILLESLLRTIRIEFWR